jgi:hypothetical protein
VKLLHVTQSCAVSPDWLASKVERTYGGEKDGHNPFLDGSVLSAITIGIAVEAAFSHSVLRPSAVGLACGGLLAGLIMCWLRAWVLLLLAGRPVLDQLNDQRWRAGAPVDPRVRWLTVPP